MMGPEYLFFFHDDNYRSYFVENNVVQVTSNPRPIRYAVEDWLKIGVVNQRNTKYFALDRSFAPGQYKFVEDAAQIVKNRFYNSGFEDKLFLLVLRRKLAYTPGVEYGFYYDLCFRGEVDLMQANVDGPVVTVNIIEGGIPKALKANETTKYQFNFKDDAKAIYVKMDGLYLHEKMNFFVTAEFTAVDHVIGSYFINQEGAAFGLAHFDTLTFNNNGGAIDYTTDLHYFLEAAQDIQGALISGKISFSYGGINSGSGGTIALKTNTGRSIVVGAYPGGAGPKEVDFSVTFDMVTGEKFFLVNDVAGVSSAIYQESNFSITFKSKFRTTYVKAYFPKDLFAKLTDKIGDGVFSCASNILSDPFKTIVATSGTAFRGLDDGYIVTSIGEFFANYSAILGLAMGVKNNKLVIEKKADWIDQADPIDLGEASELKISVATDYPFNKLKTGYPDQKIEGINGRDEFNSTFEFTAEAVTRINKSLELLSTYRTDAYGIEDYRITTDGKDTTDNNADNDVFLLHIKREPNGEVIDGIPVYELDRTLNASANGLLEKDTIFNLFLSPKHNLLRNGDFVRSCFYKLDHTYIRFQTTPKNAKLDVTENGILIDEDADIEISTLAQPLFRPILLDFKAPVPSDLLETLDDNPMKLVQFSYQGVTLKGIPIKIGIEPATGDVQNIQLLSHPDNDLSPLEFIFQ
jgi:hypothetical protein